MSEPLWSDAEIYEEAMNTAIAHAVLNEDLDNLTNDIYDTIRRVADKYKARIAELEAQAQPQPFRLDWDAIPPDYEWAVVEPFSDNYRGMHQVRAHLYEPWWDKEHGCWQSEGDSEHVYLVLDLPLGLDYRTLKQKRPAQEAS